MRASVMARVVLGALCAIALTLPATAGLQVIHCGVLIAVAGQEPIRNATVVVEDGRITRVEQGFIRGDFPEGTDFIDLSERYVMAGLIDCHTHITGEMSPTRRIEGPKLSDADSAVRGVLYASRTLDAGFTTIRNVGSEGDSAFALRDGIAQGYIRGPRILAAGSALSPTGGHGDGSNGFDRDFVHGPTFEQGVADGVAECRKAVRAQVRRGADLIKLTATGGVLSETAAGTDQQFFDDELRAIVETAHSMGRTVTAHAHGTDGINAALRAGVDSIEHGSFLDDESISLFKENDAYLVPTLLAGVTVKEIAESENSYFPPAIRAKAINVGTQLMTTIGKAYEAGVKIAFGTDSGVSKHGGNARELELMVEAGVPIEYTLISATINAADLSGILDEVGTIEVGKVADIIALDDNPLEDITTFRSVPFVMARGKVEKFEN
ncbi:MAG: metal-dependent hydrolase family protein [Planctomycetota bacterium]|jgi:imidazolonepropionase-like amidohydrolase